MKNPDEELNQIADNPFTPYWIKEVIRVALEKDCVDAANAFEFLGKAFNRRIDIIQGKAR